MTVNGYPMPIAVFLLPAFFLIIFLGFWLRDKRRLINGIWFNLFLISFVGTLGLYLASLGNETLNWVLLMAVALVVGIGLLVFLFMAFLLLWNARIVWKREAHTLGNSLTLVLGLGLLALWLVNIFAPQRFLPEWVNTLLAIFPFIVFYVLASFYNYLTTLVLYQFNHPRLNQDYIIVLGAGLLHGNQVSPLLASRINRAITFYDKQRQKGKTPPKLVFSGGQGGDESKSEGAAMQAFAIAQGIPAQDTLAEVQSKNTLENMRFSKNVIQQDAQKPAADCNIIFATNNYHTFRAGMYARQAGLKADGIGSRTSKYFLPNAVIREYLAVFLMKKRQHILVIGAMLFLDLLATGIFAWILGR
ncbi:MAG: YdcF family protein [Lactobacillus sp.]|nr:YdcF family protein [Lactobacillus sp.]